MASSRILSHSNKLKDVYSLLRRGHFASIRTSSSTVDLIPPYPLEPKTSKPHPTPTRDRVFSSPMCSRGHSNKDNMSQQPPMSYADIAALVGPSVVDVHVDVNALDGDECNDFYGSGSGFFVNKDTILTCAHVVIAKHWLSYPEYADSTKEVEIVLHNDFVLPGIVVQYNIENDLALIKVNSECLDKRWYSWPKLGISNHVRQGDIVCALGSPSSYKSTLLTGVISHTCRTGYEIGLKNKEREFFQTDIPITSGNSGGPVMNMKGEVIAVVTLGLSGFFYQNKIIERVEFVNPMDNVRKVLGI